MAGRKATGVIFLAVLLAAAVSSLAWACTKQTTVYAITPPVGPQNTAVTVEGEGLGPASVVEIRWNSTNGPVLGTASALTPAQNGNGLAFSTQVNVPEVSPGVYYLVAVSGDNSVARSAFQVTGEPSAQGGASTTSTDRVQSDLWSGFSPDASQLGEQGLAEQTSQGPNTALFAGIALTSFAASLSGALVVASRRPRRVRG